MARQSKTVNENRLSGPQELSQLHISDSVFTLAAVAGCIIQPVV